MKLDNNTNILIVGLGLLGGSYAKALKKRGFHVNAITLRQEDIDYALQNNMIDKGSDFVDKTLVSNADLVVFALYPHTFLSWIKDNQHLFKSGAIITDVTGVKCGVVYEVQNMLRGDVEFIAAHPMAGRERSGVRHSDDSVFSGANYIVTPTEKNTPQAIELCSKLGYTLGFSAVSQLDPETHDKMIAFLSQLTHCIAVTLMCSSDNEHLVKYTGDSFRDLTRIAKINADMWCELFLMNKGALLNSMKSFENSFNRLKTAIETDDSETIKEMMILSTKRREAFDR